MSLIEPIIDREFARARLQRRPFPRLRSLCKWLARAVSRLLTGRAAGRARWRLELLWLPHYYISLEQDVQDRRVRAAVLVGGHDRRAVLCDLAGVSRRAAADQERFQPELDQTEALRIARRAILEAALRRPGWQRPPATPPSLHVELVHYPFWVYYYECRRQRLGVAMLDALTGKPTGPAVKTALLAALAGASAQPQTTASEREGEARVTKM